MLDTKSIRKHSGTSEHSKTACSLFGFSGNSQCIRFSCFCWCVAVALVFVSPSFAQESSERIADEREIIDAIDESGVPVSESNIRETLMAVGRGRSEKTLALKRELDRPYKEKGNPFGAPVREKAKLEALADDAVLDRLVAFVQRETAKRPVDWSLLGPALACLGAAPGDYRAVTACQAVFSVPLENPENEAQRMCLQSAISKLARQGTPAALDTLRQCTKLGTAAELDILPESSILKDASGCPSRLAIKLAASAASLVLLHAPSEVMVAFFSDVEQDTTEVECHPLSDSIGGFVRNAEAIQSGKDPFTDPY